MLNRLLISIIVFVSFWGVQVEEISLDLNPGPGGPYATWPRDHVRQDRRVERSSHRSSQLDGDRQRHETAVEHCRDRGKEKECESLYLAPALLNNPALKNQLLLAQSSKIRSWTE